MQSGPASFETGHLMSEINVTPFVDVMLVLLIIFMVTAPMMVQGIDVNLPQASATPLPAKEDPLVISINREGEVFINDQSVGVVNLTEKLMAILSNVKDPRVFLKADREVPYGVVVNVMSLVRLAGVSTMGMITLPGQEDS
ncbi:MAG: protein TolR [Desulfobacterium sp.]|jgi:biopolymer transport protein TolR|nr:protein TolR [Desulfobacterium sp.]